MQHFDRITHVEAQVALVATPRPLLIVPVVLLLAVLTAVRPIRPTLTPLLFSARPILLVPPLLATSLIACLFSAISPVLAGWTGLCGLFARGLLARVGWRL
jgi:hypothetical protein